MIKDCANFIFCLEWNQLNKLKSDELLSSWNFCGAEMCTECIKPWHFGKSCHEELEMKYNKYALGKHLQLCPKWGSFMEKAQNCNHLTCPRCMAKFCIYWRRQFWEDHLNPLNSNACPSLINNKISRAVMSSPCLKANIWKLLVFFILYWTLMPLIIPILWPIIVWKSLKREKTFIKGGRINNKSQNYWSVMFTPLFSLIIFPWAICKLISINKKKKNKILKEN